MQAVALINCLVQTLLYEIRCQLLSWFCLNVCVIYDLLFTFILNCLKFFSLLCLRVPCEDQHLLIGLAFCGTGKYISCEREICQQKFLFWELLVKYGCHRREQLIIRFNPVHGADLIQALFMFIGYIPRASFLSIPAFPTHILSFRKSGKNCELPCGV